MRESARGRKRGGEGQRAGAGRRDAAGFAEQPVRVNPIRQWRGWSRADPAELLVQPAAHGADTAATVAVAGEDQGAGELSHRNGP